ncbi:MULTISPECIES: IclR family transcriptional regulator [unclassified Streptomyces]|uniref:IclR family transcriptional regulator n=1 Tax=unclassified Streptomyces TaxID=2593676 RepID=UPI001C57F6E7|nr:MULTISPECIES: helix-turn-helix domain-containing protein [unclassified Streptomyces]MBW1598539.1 helix-turn-helix domain-containing protein [Streptomyces sp. JJ38]MCZ7414497.1 helix-turn-helix domain-containing protein [Streptomyces sp. WMMC897]MCZ7431453.1 helix-turn-helix domain-containing protein [Streptomyces sp. WMMC1477]
MTAETSQTLDRGLRVLKLLADTDHGLTVTELSSKLGVNRTVIYRLLATLEQHSLIRRDLGGRARVGLGVLGLGRQVHPLVREAALPALRSLAEEVGATAHLTLVDGVDALAVAVVEPSWTDYHVAYRPGFRHPLDRGAAGRAILAGRGPGYEQPGGYVLTHGELEAGASGAAAPLLGVAGIEGSVGVVMLADSVPEKVGDRVVAAAQEVADALR